MNGIPPSSRSSTPFSQKRGLFSDSDMSDEEPTPKRLKSSISESQSSDMAFPEGVIDVYPDGDVLLVVNGIAGVNKRVSIRVSSTALSIGSRVFKRLLLETPPADSLSHVSKRLDLPEDDGDSIFLLSNILHLRNDALPARLQPECLSNFIKIAVKYDAVIATSRCASQWFDHIYTKIPDAPAFQMCEAALLLNDPVYFTRFTTRWVQQQLPGQTVEGVSENIPNRRRLAAELLSRQKDSLSALKTDIDLLVDPCAEALSSTSKHYPDTAPGEAPDDQGDPDHCGADKENATDILASLRDAKIWPATKWPPTIQAILKLIDEYRIPEADVDEQCAFCIQVEERFGQNLELVRKLHEGRLWGLCLDCYKAGGLNEGECRMEHPKAINLSASVIARRMGEEVRKVGMGEEEMED